MYAECIVLDFGLNVSTVARDSVKEIQVGKRFAEQVRRALTPS